MIDLHYKLQGTRTSTPSEIAYLSVTDKRAKLIFAIHVYASDSVTLEVFDFEEYADYLGYGVKAAKAIRAAKCGDLESVKAALDGVVQYELAEAT